MTGSIDPLIKTGVRANFSSMGDSPVAISALVAKVQSRSVPLSQCIAEALPIAQAAGDAGFEDFCRHELAGWDVKKPGRDKSLSYREMPVFVSPFGEINTTYLGWGGDLSSALDYMRNDKENFFPFTLIVTYPVSQLEADLSGHSLKGLLTVQLRQGDLLKQCDTPDRMVTAYGRGDTYALLLEAIRRELTQHLLTLLPRAILE